MVRKIILFILLLSLITVLVKAETAIATTKITYADTILAKVISEIFGYPQVLLEKNKLSNETVEFLKKLNISEIIIIGGPAVVSYEVENELKNLGYDVIRIWGVERYETSALVALYFWDNVDEAIIITEELANEKANFRIINIVRDAVEYAIENRIPILITTPGNLEKNVIDALKSLGVKKVKIFTITGNLGIIPEELKTLGIEYEIVREIQIPCQELFKICILSNESWNLTQDVLIYGRCIKIVPIEENDTGKECNFIIRNISNAKEFANRFSYRYVFEKRKEVMKKLSEVIKEKVYIILTDIAKRKKDISEEYAKCYFEIIEKIKENEEIYKEALECLNNISENRWKKGIFIKDFEKQNIEKVVSDIEKIIKNVTGILNITLEEPLREMPSISEVREKLIERVRERIVKRIKEYCAQVITCACSPFGICKSFPTPCHVPLFWKVVPCENITNKTKTLPGGK